MYRATVTAATSCDWEGNRKSDRAHWPCVTTDLSGLFTYGLKISRKTSNTPQRVYGILYLTFRVVHGSILLTRPDPIRIDNSLFDCVAPRKKNDRIDIGQQAVMIC